MKTFIHTLTNTYKAVRLLSNPAVSAILEKELGSHGYEPTKSKLEQAESETQAPLGRNSAFFHKHYVVQVVN